VKKRYQCFREGASNSPTGNEAVQLFDQSPKKQCTLTDSEA
jgi:hypothetical protein